MEMVNAWICELAFLAGGILYGCRKERRENFPLRFLCCGAVFVLFSGLAYVLGREQQQPFDLFLRLFGFGFIIAFLHFCWEVSWSAAVYDSIWAFLLWQLMYELWLGYRISEYRILWRTALGRHLEPLLIFIAGYFIAAVTVIRWMSEGGTKKIGPRQLISALLIFGVLLILAVSPGSVEMQPGEWQVLYLSQLLLTVVLYLQNELFKKSLMRQELAVMNLLWKKEQEQYELARENIALINQKCHDLKHQIRAIRNVSSEERDRYLEEIEDSVRIYEAIVKTGNEVLDTILTEKSLYCKERGIVVSCVADGSQMGFIHTVDLYAILGNAMDNAIEAVEKFKHAEKRQIDVLIYRQQNFLVVNVINPLKGKLVYEEELPVTTKGDRQYHGFGLKSMRYLVKKYDGFLNVSTEDGCFSLKILIPIPAGRE